MRLVALALALPVLGIGFGILRRLGGRHVPRPSWATDLAFWFLTGLFTKNLAFVVGVLALLPRAWARGLPVGEAVHGWGPVGALPGPVQAVLALVLVDFASYWLHRMHHRSARLWRLHRVHHSSLHLDWLAAARVHPLNAVTQRVPLVLLLYVSGLDLVVLGGATGALVLYGLLLHEDLPWRFGPLGRVFVTPAFHRWHHAEPIEGGCNFGALLVVWDRLFGTFHLPEGSPETVGVEVRRGFFGLLALRS